MYIVRGVAPDLIENKILSLSHWQEESQSSHQVFEDGMCIGQDSCG